MITSPMVYILAGITFAAFALLSRAGMPAIRSAGATPPSGAAGAFELPAGDRLGDFGNGLLVLALVAIAGRAAGPGRATRPAARPRRWGRARHGNRLFLPRW
jgi:uncharacterized membrane protein